MILEYDFIHPPKEVFLNEVHATLGWDPKSKRAAEKATVVLSEKDGLLWFPTPQHLPMHGMPSPLITIMIGVYKRMLMEKIRTFKNPILWLFYKSYIREFRSISHTYIARYYLKPQYYARSVREILRVAQLFFGKEDPTYHSFAHDIAMIFQFDTAYRYRAQLILTHIDQENDPKKELLTIIRHARMQERKGDVTMESKWKSIEQLVKIAMVFPPFKRKVKQILQEIRPDEFEMDSSDLCYAYEPQ